MIPRYNIADLCSKKVVRVSEFALVMGCRSSLKGDHKEIRTSRTYSSARVYAMSGTTGTWSSPLPVSCYLETEM